MGASGTVRADGCQPVSATCPEGGWEPTVPTASAQRPHSCEQSPASMSPAASPPCPSVQAHPAE